MRFIRYIVLIMIPSLCNAQGAMSPKQYQESDVSVSIPYADYGWSDTEAISYLLSKMTFGAKPGQIEAVQNEGLNKWFSRQLNATNDPSFERIIQEQFPTTALSMQEIAEKYPSPGVTLILLNLRFRRSKQFKKDIEENLQVNEMLGKINRAVANVDRRLMYELEGSQFLKKYFEKMDIGNFMELMYQLRAQKLVRAIENEHQLQEVMSDFWFNHFNVSITRINDAAPFVLAYERDVIRANALGNFGEMVRKSAKHPAMLFYLDNNQSNAAVDTKTLEKTKNIDNEKLNNSKLKQFLQKPGINENYARELLELHTMGVDGGYSQNDVQELARILTGWKSDPTLVDYPSILEFIVKRNIKKSKKSFRENGFYFDARRHDAQKKLFLGEVYPKNKGIEEGERAIEKIITHPSTATFVCTKLVKRFLDDDPPKTLIEKMSQTYLSSGGNIKLILKTMVEAEDFWNPRYKETKIKTPFEFLVSSLRKTDVTITNPQELVRWCIKLGEPIFAYQVPTGFPDYQEYWISGTGLINRYKFALALVNHNIDGVEVPKNLEDKKSKLEIGGPKFQKQ